MKKLFVKIFLWLFIVFTSGYGKLYANEAVTPVTAGIFSLTVNQLFSDTSNHNLFDSNYKTALRASEKSIDKIDPTDTEDEEDENASYKSLSFKKFTEINGYCIPAYNPIALQYLYNITVQQKAQPIGKHFVFVPVAGKWYVLFSVFRI